MSRSCREVSPQCRRGVAKCRGGVARCRRSVAAVSPSVAEVSPNVANRRRSVDAVAERQVTLSDKSHPAILLEGMLWTIWEWFKCRWVSRWCRGGVAGVAAASRAVAQMSQRCRAVSRSVAKVSHSVAGMSRECRGVSRLCRAGVASVAELSLGVDMTIFLSELAALGGLL